jgi:hypothetical protein
MSCLTPSQILGVFVSVVIGMALGPVLAKLVDAALFHRLACNRLSAENERLREERNLALLGSSDVRIKLLEELHDRGELS